MEQRLRKGQERREGMMGRREREIKRKGREGGRIGEKEEELERGRVKSFKLSMFSSRLVRGVEGCSNVPRLRWCRS